MTKASTFASASLTISIHTASGTSLCARWNMPMTWLNTRKPVLEAPVMPSSFLMSVCLVVASSCP